MGQENGQRERIVGERGRKGNGISGRGTSQWAAPHEIKASRNQRTVPREGRGRGRGALPPPSLFDIHPVVGPLCSFACSACSVLPVLSSPNRLLISFCWPSVSAPRCCQQRAVAARSRGCRGDHAHAGDAPSAPSHSTALRVRVSSCFFFLPLGLSTQPLVIALRMG